MWTYLCFKNKIILNQVRIMMYEMLLYAMVWYKGCESTILYVMIWYFNAMQWDCNAMQWDFIPLIAMVYVVKDPSIHSTFYTFLSSCTMIMAHVYSFFC